MSIDPTAPLKVLIVEDNIGDARLFEELLDDNFYRDFETDHAPDLETAEAKLGAENEYDVVLTDLDLPDSLGLETLKAVRRMTTAPVVVATGVSERETGFASMQAGAVDFVSKGGPEAPAIARVLAYAVERDRMRAAIEDLEADVRARAELSALTEITESAPSKVTAASFAENPFKETAPEEFDALASTYRDILGAALEEKRFKRPRQTRDRLKHMSARLAGWRCGPRDVIDVHMTTLQRLSGDLSAKHKKALGEESRFLLIELLGYLVLSYRSQAIS